MKLRYSGFTILTLMILFSLFALFSWVAQQKQQDLLNESVDFYTRILANQLWNVDQHAAQETLSLIKQGGEFNAISVFYPDGVPFVQDLRQPPIRQGEEWFRRLGLMPQRTLTRVLVYKGEDLGTLSLEWIDRGILYILYGGLIVALLSMIVVIYSRQLAQQRKLETQEELRQEIAQRIKAEGALTRAKQEAEKANRIKSEFLANMSHEIRTPLHVILGYTEILENKMRGNAEFKTLSVYFEYIQRASQRLQDTIQKIIDISRFHIEDFPFTIVSVLLKPLLESTIQELQVLAERKGLYLKLSNLAPDSVVRGDTYAVHQAHVNIIENAIKYSHSGGVEVYVTEETDSVSVSVTDTGVGISREFLPYIFDEFSQETTGYDRPFEGTGLGLALTRKFVEAGGGSVSITSQKGKGTTLTLHFAKGDPSAIANQPKSAERKKTVKTDLQSGNPLRILIVEDDPYTQEFLSTALGNRFLPDFAANADDAMNYLDTESYALVLMDVSLKGAMDGLALTKTIRNSRRFQKLPVIALTAHALDRDRDKAFAAGCNAFLAKPYSLDRLLELMAEVLEKEQHN